MPNDERNYGVIPLREETWQWLYGVALFGAGASGMEGVRVVLLGLLGPGIHRFFEALEAGVICLGPQLLPDGTLVVRLGLFHGAGDPLRPIWWTMAGAGQLEFDEQETAWAYEMAERTGQAGELEVPDPDDFGEGEPS